VSVSYGSSHTWFHALLALRDMGDIRTVESWAYDIYFLDQYPQFILVSAFLNSGL